MWYENTWFLLVTKSELLLIVLWFVAFIHERRKCQFLLEVGENKIVNFFPIDIRGPSDFYPQLSTLDFCFTGFFLFFYRHVKFFSTSWPLSLYFCLPGSFFLLLLIRLAPQNSDLSLKVTFPGRPPTFFSASNLIYLFTLTIFFEYEDPKVGSTSCCPPPSPQCWEQGSGHIGVAWKVLNEWLFKKLIS